jgi:Ala-tRNA(Pro) deacylase
MTVVDEVLDRAAIEFEPISHPRTERAVDEAVSLGVPAEDVAKTVVLRIGEGFLRAVVPASERLDLHKIREQVPADGHARLATEPELEAAYPEFEVGAVPPFGGRSDSVVVDPRVAERESVVLEAGSHDRSLRMRTEDLLRLTAAHVVDVCED